MDDLIERLRSKHCCNASMAMGNPYGCNCDEAADRIAALEEALRKCRDQFDWYVTSHLSKTPPDIKKAKTNQDFRDLCDAALTGSDKPGKRWG